MRTVAALLALVATADCFGVSSPTALRTRTSVPVMGSGKPNNTPAKFYPKGPFGGYEKVGVDSDSSWIGDQSKGVQIQKFEKGEDYLFFQGPAPKTAVQEDLPSFFSADNFADMEITPFQIGITGVGLATFGVVAGVVVGAI